MNTYNNLIYEKSLYLQDHATNPINWYPWSDEAFQKAIGENKPIFLSIGYSTCHWCHVMKEESFEDCEVANLLNEFYISIKVDREERPDIDILYMHVAQKFLGSGGWPLNVIITPQQKPIFITTYLKKEQLKQVLIKINQEWTFNQEDIIINSKKVIQSIQNDFNYNEKTFIRYEELIIKAKDILVQNFDHTYGGFQNKPKFPTPHYLLFLLYYYKMTNDKTILQMGQKTLYQMYKGGIFDHLNYGFSRYSVDRFWLVPHFEKMLSDNSLLLITYLLYYSQTKDEVLKDISEKIICFLDSFLKDSAGGFYSAIDADSDGTEGSFYLWELSEIQTILPLFEAQHIIKYFNLTDKGNFNGYNILNLIHKSDNEIRKGIPLKIQSIISKLRNYQKTKIPPRIDKKILTAWNSLTVWAYCLANKILDENEYLFSAKKTLDFLLGNLLGKNQQLYTRFIDGEKKHLANLKDYAYFINSLIEFYNLTYDELYLEKANFFTNEALKLFYDEINGGFYFTQKSNDLLVRPKDLADSATLSGNSIMVYNLIRLNNLTYNPKYTTIIRKVFQVIKFRISKSPASYPSLLISYMIYKTPHTHIIIVYKKENDIINFKKILNHQFIPFITVIYLHKSTLTHSKNFSEYLIVKDFGVFICIDGVCDEPIYEVSEALEQIMLIIS